MPARPTEHASRCYPDLASACAAIPCPSVHTCARERESARDNMLRHPADFGGVVVPIRGSDQADGILVACHGW